MKINRTVKYSTSFNVEIPFMISVKTLLSSKKRDLCREFSKVLRGTLFHTYDGLCFHRYYQINIIESCLKISICVVDFLNNRLMTYVYCATQLINRDEFKIHVFLSQPKKKYLNLLTKYGANIAFLLPV